MRKPSALPRESTDRRYFHRCPLCTNTSYQHFVSAGGQVYRLFLLSGTQKFPRRIGEDVAMETPAIAEDRLRRLGVERCRAEPLIGGLEVIAVEIDEPSIARDRRVQLL